MLSVTDILKVLVTCIPFESATVMVPPDESEQSIHLEFEETQGTEIPMKN